MGINVNLTPELEEWVRGMVASGHYASANEVVCEALRLMEGKDQSDAARVQQLRNDVPEGLESGESAGWDAGQVKQHARVKSLAGVLDKFARFSPDFMAGGRKEHEQQERESL